MLSLRHEEGLLEKEFNQLHHHCELEGCKTAVTHSKPLLIQPLLLSSKPSKKCTSLRTLHFVYLFEPEEACRAVHAVHSAFTSDSCIFQQNNFLQAVWKSKALIVRVHNDNSQATTHHTLNSQAIREMSNDICS